MSQERIKRDILFVLGTVAACYLVTKILAYDLSNSAAQQGEINFRFIIDSLVAVVFGLFIFRYALIKAVPPILSGQLAGDIPDPVQYPAEREKTRIIYASRWFVKTRWIAVGSALCMVLIASEVFRIIQESVFWPLVFLCLLLGLFNMLVHELHKRRLVLRHLLSIQVYTDLTILAAMLHFAGGIENPLSLLTLCHVIIAGVLLSRRSCYGTAGFASLLLVLLAWTEWSGLIAHYPLHGAASEPSGDLSSAEVVFVAGWTVIQCGFLFLTAYLVTTLAKKLRSDEQLLEDLANQAFAERRILEESLETTRTALRVIGQDLECRWVNQKWQEWFRPHADSEPNNTMEGYACPGECQGPHGACHVGHPSKTYKTVQLTMKDGIVRTSELVVPEKDQDRPGEAASIANKRFIRITTAPLYGPDGSILEVAELAQDITQAKQAQIQMMQASKMAAVGEFAGHVAHEVNNPLAIISAKARLLLSDHKEGMSAKVGSEMDKIVHLSDRVARIAQGLLSYCRPTGTKQERLDICEPVRKVISMIEQRAKVAGVAIETHFPDRPAYIKSNSGEMEQVFMNLFLNALDAMPDGGKLFITISNDCRFSNGLPAIEVIFKDTGEGIAHDIQDRIFEPFFSTKQEGKGTGLGLSICDGLIRSHGGEIALASGKEKGTCFTIKLPVYSDDKEKHDHGF